MTKCLTRTIITAVLFLCLTGCAKADSAPSSVSTVPSDPEPSPSLTISVVHDPDAKPTYIPSEECGGFLIDGLTYQNVTNVTIEINETIVKLEDALQSGSISLEEIFAAASQDSRDGFCEKTQESSHGLTHFTFSYPDFNLRIVNDVYETPDGKQHLIQDIAVYSSDAGNATFILGPYTKFMDYSTGYYMDREDWGLSFELENISASGIRIRCTQSGGQQIGQLRVTGYGLTTSDGFVPKKIGEGFLPELDFDLEMNGTSVLDLDWTQVYGEVPSESYEIILYIDDIFDEEQVHPLMEDYYTWQIYVLKFSIP